jgi:hypothetical protein
MNVGCQKALLWKSKVYVECMNTSLVLRKGYNYSEITGQNYH